MQNKAVQIIVGLIMLVFILYALTIVAPLLALPHPILQLIYLLIAVIVVLWFLRVFGVWTGE